MRKVSPPCVVTIAGTDPSGGAGIQADIKVISATGGYAASVITALCAQNTQGVQAIEAVSADFVRQQMQSVFSDLNVRAVKIGMLHEARIIDAVSSELEKFKPINMVFDPVMVAKDGSLLLDLDTIAFLKESLFRLITLITPNIFEAEHLLGADITTLAEMELAAVTIGKQFNISVLLKGGHLSGQQSSDVLYNIQGDACCWFHAERTHTKNTHGTGCSLSSAIASYLAQGCSLSQAVDIAKQYITKAIQSGAGHQIGCGNGPIDHFYFLNPLFFKSLNSVYR